MLKFIYQSALQLFLSLASISNYFPRSPECKILSCIPRQHKTCQKMALGWSWIQLDSEEATTEVAEVIQRVQLPWRCYSCWCVAAVAVQVSASGCSVECDTPCSWGDAGKIGGDGGGGDGDGAALPSGLSHTAAHSQHEVLFMYGPFMGLKCLHWMNYSLFSQVGKSVHSNSTSIITQSACI